MLVVPEAHGVVKEVKKQTLEEYFTEKTGVVIAEDALDVVRIISDYLKEREKQDAKTST